MPGPVYKPDSCFSSTVGMDQGAVLTVPDQGCLRPVSRECDTRPQDHIQGGEEGPCQPYTCTV